MHDGVQFDLVQGQGNDPLEVGNPCSEAIFSAIYDGR